MFSIESERVKLIHLNIRTEKHGDDDVGRLAAALGHEVVLSLTPPKPSASNDDGEEAA